MKIMELIQSCDALFPNEFTLEEKLLWCDELGALLSREHTEKTKLIAASLKDGAFVLPRGLGLLDIDRVVLGEMLIKKSDAPRHGICFFQEGDFVTVYGTNMSLDVKFLCKSPYEKIRRAALFGTTFLAEENKIKLKECPFFKGDTISIKSGEDTHTRVVGDIKKTSEGFFLELDNGLPIQGENCGDIKRVITDETVCQAPFDMMYYDFINAKICFYQRDYDSYNAHMALFNSRLEDYDRYIIKNKPILCDTRVTNWWS